MRNLFKEIKGGWNYCTSDDLDTILYIVLGVIAPLMSIIFLFSFSN